MRDDALPEELAVMAMFDEVSPPSALWPRPIDARTRMTDRRRKLARSGARLMPLAAGLGMAAVLVAALWSRDNRSPAQATRPTAGPSAAAVPAPSGTPAPVPAAGQRFVWIRYLSIPPYGQHEVVHVLDWTGALRAAFSLPAWPSTSTNGVSVVGVAPDGRVGLLSTGDVVDWTGRKVGHIVLPVDASSNAERWSNDDRHVCSAAAAPASEVLTLLDSSGAPRIVAVLPDAGWDAGMPATQQWGRDVTVLTCSQANDRAVVMRTTSPPDGVDSGSIWTVQLSTGRVISKVDVTIAGVWSAWASSDGSRLVYYPVTGTRLVTPPAANSRSPQQPIGPPPQPSAFPEPVFGNPTVVDLNTGRAIGEVPRGDEGVMGLSADGSVAVTSVASETGPPQGIRLVDLASGRAVASRQGVNTVGVAIDPVSGDYMVETVSWGAKNTLGLELVDTAGRWQDLPSTFGDVTTSAAIGN